MKKPKISPTPKTTPATALPLQQLLDELDELPRTLREIVNGIVGRIEGQIVHVHASVSLALGEKRIPAGRAHDIRDMLMLVRSLEVKPAKGRRRDLKKLEAVTKELRQVVDRWEE